MHDRITAAVGEYRHTTGLLNGSIKPSGCTVEFIHVQPIYRAFAPMVRELRYDVSEMALATYLQAYEAGKDISLLPIVLSGDFHHHSLTRWPGSMVIEPRDLRNQRVGVRAYSQTTGLWVRGILREEFDIRASEITWVTTEGPHVREYVEPDHVERTTGTVADALRGGVVKAAVLGPLALDDEAEPLVPIIPDWRAAEERWGERHGTIPINHMLTVRRELLRSQPEKVRAIYDAFCRGIDDSLPDGPTTPGERALRYDLCDPLLAALNTAITYALEQGVIRTRMTAEELFSDFREHLAGAAGRTLR